jgi:hypothetical protein
MIFAQHIDVYLDYYAIIMFILAVISNKILCVMIEK